MTGVERWTREVTGRLVALRPERYAVLAPPASMRSRVAGQAWEQLVLPARAARARAALIFSPANLAPSLWPRNVVVLHDAAVLRNSSDYSLGYRLWHARLGLSIARRALRVVTVSQFSRRELIAVGQLDPERIVVIGGGVDRRFRPDARDEEVSRKYRLDRPYVLTVGTDDPRKNLMALQPTATRLRRAGIDLVWAGGGRSHIGGATEVEGMHALGYVDDRELPALYAGALAFVLPSRYEGFGLTCLEAMASGTPVVAADRAALPETCGGAAVLVDPDDPGAVADEVIRAVTDEQARSRLRAAGLDRAAGRSWDSTTLEVDRLLTELAEG